MGEKVYIVKKMKKEKMGMPLIGDEFPKMKVQTTKGMMKLPKAFKGKWFVLFSHPADLHLSAQQNSLPSRRDTRNSGI